MSDRKDKPRQYRPPRLKEYGSITAITRTSGNKNKMPDGMKGKFNKT